MPNCAKCHATLNLFFRGGRAKEAAEHGFCLPCLGTLESHHGCELLALVEEVPHGAILVDSGFRIRAANDPACNLLRATWVALIGHQLREFISCDHPQDLAPWYGDHASPRRVVHPLLERKIQHREEGTVIRPCREVTAPNPPSEASLRVTSLSVGDFVLVRLDPKAEPVRSRFQRLLGQHIPKRVFSRIK